MEEYTLVTFRRGVCLICGNDTAKTVFKAVVMNKYDAVYRFCDKCNFLFVENPYWLAEAYKNPINVYDTGVLARNIALSKRVSVVLYFLFGRTHRYLDYAGGYGIFVRLMRDVGFDFYWYDTYCENLLAKGFELQNDLSNFELITCFEALEHFTNPLEHVKKMFELGDNIILTTPILPSGTPESPQWPFYGFEHGQHICFFSQRTLQNIAEKFNCNLVLLPKSIFLLTKRKLETRIFNLLFKILGYERLYRHVKKQMQSKTDADNKFLVSLRNCDGL